MSRVPSAPFMHMEQRHSSGATPFVLDDRMHSDPSLGPQGNPPAGGWAPDSHQVLGIKQDTSDMQVRSDLSGSH